MVLRNGLRSNLRAKGRTALFTLLLFALTVTLALGLGMWAATGGMLAQCDETYTSMALVEYLGADYPSTDTADDLVRAAAAALDDAAIAGQTGVTLWERTDRTVVQPAGYARSSGNMPYANYMVFVASSPTPFRQTGWHTVPAQELPADRLVQNTTTQTFTFYEDGEITKTIPGFFYDPQTGIYTAYVWNEAEQAADAVEYTEDQLPAEYWAGDTTDYSEIGTFRTDNLGDTLCYYDPRDDAYSVYGEYIAGYTVIVNHLLYSREGRDGILVNIEANGTGFVPQSGKQYLVHGALLESNSSNRTMALLDFYEGCETPPYQEVSGPDDPAVAGGPFAEAAERYRTANAYAFLQASDDIAALEPFHQGTLFLEEGRFPEPGEAGVCVLSGATARSAGLAPGDVVELSMLSSDPADQYELAPTGETRSLTVVGVTNAAASYDGWIWVSGAEGGFAAPLYGCELGRLVLQNAAARQAVEALQATMPAQVQITLYDQGYANAAQPLQSMRSTALAVTLASAAGALAALVLFALLFVGRQQETVTILFSLGTPKGKIALWLLSGAAAIAAVAAGGGALVGGALLNRVLQLALRAAQDLYSADQRYSESLIGLHKEMSYPATVPLWPAALAGAAVFAAAMLLCLVFLRQATRRAAPKKGRLAVRTPHGGTSVAGRGALRFALLSVRRGGARSAVVPAAALVLALFLGVLGGTTQSWQRQLDGLVAQSKIQGRLASTDGRASTGLVVSPQTVRDLWETGLLEEVSVSKGWNYWVASEMPNFGSGSFSQESMLLWISKQPQLVALNSLASAPDFAYTKDPAITWLDGWDEGFLADNSYPCCLSQFYGYELPAYPALVNQSFLEAHGLALGDEYQIQTRFDLDLGSIVLPVRLEIVGSFNLTGSKNTIYLPLSFYFDPDWLFGPKSFAGEKVEYPLSTLERAQAYLRQKNTFAACSFTLGDAAQLEALRQALYDGGYSWAGTLRSNRTTIVLADATFVETMGALGRSIAFGQILFPILLAVVGVLGFIISWLMVNGRRMELAVMRGLGARRGYVFRCYFAEQAGLCLAGCAAACIPLLLLPGGGAARWGAVGAFLLCYWIGCACSVLAVEHTNLMALLSERE